MDKPDRLAHYADPDYDPVKAREYYLKNRKLKGRRRGKLDPGSRGRPTASEPASVTQIPKPSRSGEEKRADAKAQVEALQGKLDRLKDVLSELVAAAKARAGADPEENKKKAEKNKEEKKLSPAERKKKAKEDKERREKEEKKNPSQQVQALQEQIADVQQKIKDAREDIAEAGQRKQRQKARNNANPQTARGR